MYSNRKLGKARRYKVRWVMEFPDNPKQLRDMFETRNRNRKEGRNQLKSSSDKASEVKAVGTKRNEV